MGLGQNLRSTPHTLDRPQLAPFQFALRPPSDRSSRLAGSLATATAPNSNRQWYIIQHLRRDTHGTTRNTPTTTHAMLRNIQPLTLGAPAKRRYVKRGKELGAGPPGAQKPLHPARRSRKYTGSERRRPTAPSALDCLCALGNGWSVDTPPPHRFWQGACPKEGHTLPARRRAMCADNFRNPYYRNRAQAFLPTRPGPQYTSAKTAAGRRRPPPTLLTRCRLTCHPHEKDMPAATNWTIEVQS